MKNPSYYLLACIGIFFTIVIQGQDLDWYNLETKIDSLIPSQINDTTPGVVVGIYKDGKVVFSKGYGLANMEYGIPNDSKMVYNLGSVSKQFLGYAFAMLHVKGSLHLDDPVTMYLDDWPEFEQPVTLRHLLSHTSGYREAYALSNLAGRMIDVDRLSREECLEVVRRQPKLEFIPGSQHTYNSTAWVILAEILENVTKMPADEWVETNIIQPLGMVDTHIESYVGEVITNAAKCYYYDNELGFVNPESNRAIFGAADIYTNIKDLAKWINNFQSPKVGDNEVNNLFFKPFILNDGSSSNYGLGIKSSNYRGLKTYWHTGSHAAFHTWQVYFPDYNLGIITISNSGSYFDTKKIEDILLKEQMTEPLVKENQSNRRKNLQSFNGDLTEFQGDFWSDELETVYHLTVKDDSLIIRHRWIGEVTLEPIGEDLFYTDWSWGMDVKFIRNLEREITGFSINYGRTKDVQFQRKDL